MNTRLKKVFANINFWIMLAPALIWMVLFNIVPMFGITMAFQDFNPSLGILGSKWVGLKNFNYMFQLSDTRQIFFNTIFIAGLKIIFNLLVPVTFALMLNEVRQAGFKKGVQTIVYLPHFLSWVILAGILLDVFAYSGPVNRILEAVFGMEPVKFFAKASLFRWFAIFSDVWKEFGFNAVIYLAALTGINLNLYEAAAIDGASKWKRTWHITLPGISNTIVLMTILGLGSVLNAGFDQIFNLYNPLVYATGDIIDTWVYRVGLQNLQFSLATAVGLLKSVVGFIMITTSYGLAYKFADYKVF